LKDIILITKPYTGTHTLTYLLGMLGGAKLYNNHISTDNSIRIIMKAVELMPDSVVLCTQRSLAAHQASWERHGSDPKDLGVAHRVEDKLVPQLPIDRTFFLTIDGIDSVKTAVIERLCLKAEIPITAEMWNFMETWPRLNSTEPGGLELSEERKDQLEHLKADAQLGEHLRKAYGYNVNKGVRHAT
jgi:hypothetical protein